MRRIARDALAIVLTGVVLGMVHNQLQLSSRPPRGLSWVGSAPGLASVESSLGGNASAAEGEVSRAPASPADASVPRPDRRAESPSASHDAPSAVDVGRTRPAGGARSSTDPPGAGGIAASSPTDAVPAPGVAASSPSAVPVIPDVAGPLKVELATVRKLIDAGAALVVDAREPGEFAEGHLPGAINIPYEVAGSEPERLERLDARGRPIIVYCSGGSCESSALLAAMLVRDFGKRRVLVYEGGYPEWLAAGNRIAKGGG